eukprot:Skav226879  [mRNA]  locus=scaffold1187:253174:253788:+ [translate_table: standard]
MYRSTTFNLVINHQRSALSAAEVSGLTFVVFCLGAATQQWMETGLGDAPADDAVRADLAGMLGLAELSSRADEDPDKAKAGRLVIVGFAKVTLENMPQLLLQSSFLALVFDELTPLGRAKVLLSILLGLASASLKIWEAMKELVRLSCRNRAKWGCEGWCFAFIFSALFMLAPVAVLWTVAKLYFVLHCDTHMWNLGSGCVEWT